MEEHVICIFDIHVPNPLKKVSLVSKNISCPAGLMRVFRFQLPRDPFRCEPRLFSPFERRLCSAFQCSFLSWFNSLVLSISPSLLNFVSCIRQGFEDLITLLSHHGRHVSPFLAFSKSPNTIPVPSTIAFHSTSCILCASSSWVSPSRHSTSLTTIGAPMSTSPMT